MPTFGLTGAVSTTEHAVLAGQYGADYGVMGPNDWRVTAVAGANQTVTVAPGTGYGKGAIDVDTPEATLDATMSPGGLPGTGTRYDTLVRRRTWADGSSEFVLLEGTSAKAISAQRVVNPGVQDDQPIALVPFVAGQQMPGTPIDLRCWHGNAGLVVASVEALAYLDRLGSHVRVQDTGLEYTRVLDQQGNPVWALPAPTSWAPISASVPAVGVSITSGTFGIGEAIEVPAAARDRVIDVDFGALAASMSASAADVVLRRGTTDLRRIKLREVNDSGSSRFSEKLSAGASASYQIVVTTAGPVSISGDGRFTYMTINARAL